MCSQQFTNKCSAIPSEKKKKIGHKIIASDDKWLQLNNSQADKTEMSTGCTAILMPQVEK